ncbi:hypothetical protein [Herpetosiphon geysericola]|uniref:Uncharacterized protein n=1 Tax=Herpetosiphon geysericola TaxID=70996 RepID=A0A0P6Y4V0_9CHLR|nr:hypothetical protein [Herpetosiphon geysericola]KPL80203.1 hypothetical protein SE18_24410 [Herpetosiphon geysericola]
MKGTQCSHCGEQAMPSDHYCSPCKITAKLLANAVKQLRLTGEQQQTLWRMTYHSSRKTRVLLETLRGH